MPSALKLMLLGLVSSAANSASVLRLLLGLDWLISLSLSAINRTATLCALPALSELRMLILRHGAGLSAKPTILSSIRLACWAFTRFISNVRGDLTAFWIAG